MFFDNFQRVCDERGVKPGRVCLNIGLSKNASSNWKSNHTIPKEDVLEKLAAELKCEVADFFRPETAPPKFHTVYDALAYQSCKDDEAYKSALERMTPPETEVDDDDEEECLVYKGNIYYPDTDEYYVVALMTTLGRRQHHEFMDLVYDFVDERGLDDREGRE